jgi:heme-degrading monooxygenase HmoA
VTEEARVYVALFYGQVNPGVDPDEYAAIGMRMYELAAQMPGFAALHKVDLPDGRELAIAYFETEEQMKAWYDHPEHREIQVRARESLLDDYLIEVCEIKRAYTKETSLFAQLIQQDQTLPQPTA